MPAPIDVQAQSTAWFSIVLDTPVSEAGHSFSEIRNDNDLGSAASLFQTQPDPRKPSSPMDSFAELSNIMAEFEKHVTASDGQKVTTRFGGIREKLSSLLSKYQAEGECLASFSSRAGAQKFIDDLGLNGLTIRPAANGGFEVAIDLSPLSSLIDSIPAMGQAGLELPVTWDMASYNAWLSVKDCYTEQLQLVIEAVGEKCRRDQQRDTLIKVNNRLMGRNERSRLRGSQ